MNQYIPYIKSSIIHGHRRHASPCVSNPFEIQNAQRRHVTERLATFTAVIVEMATSHQQHITDTRTWRDPRTEVSHIVSPTSTITHILSYVP